MPGRWGVNKQEKNFSSERWNRKDWQILINRDSQQTIQRVWAFRRGPCASRNWGKRHSTKREVDLLWEFHPQTGGVC